MSISTGRTPRRKEVENMWQHQCIDTLPALVSTGFSTRSTEVAIIPTDRTSQRKEVASSANLQVIDRNVVNGILATCKKYFTPSNEPMFDDVYEILRDAYKSTLFFYLNTWTFSKILICAMRHDVCRHLEDDMLSYRSP